MTADDGKMQQETITTALAVVTAILSDDDALIRPTVRDVAKELLADDAYDHARLYVYIHQAAQLTELALGIAAMASSKPISEIQAVLAAAVSSADWSDGPGE